MTAGFFQPLPPTTVVVDKALSHCESLRVCPGKTVAVVTINEMKMAAPGLSFQAFLRMLDQRTVCFGCTGKISADSFQKRFLALRFKVDNIFKSEEPDIFEGIFIAKDEDITKLVKLSVEEVFVEGSGQQPERPPKNCKQDRRGGIGVVVKWSMAYQDGCGLTLGEEVEQCNAFLSRIPVTTKHISKAGRADMLTLMAMH
nr:uncharacterized protein LOC129429840 isoform X2 [Misgurnus anguillicaudatus]